MGQFVSSNKSTQNVSNNNNSTCNVHNENKEGTTLLWFDPNIGSREDTLETQKMLRCINDYVIFHTDLEECVKFIQSVEKETILLITSGSKASQLLPRVASLRQIDSIFIFCMKKSRYEYLIDEYSKINGIYVQINDLCQAIKCQTNLIDKQLQTFSFFDQRQKATRDLSRESTEFLWFQLFHHIINRLPRNQQSKQQMIEICRQYYHGNTKELKLIDQFEQEYQPEEAIRWYTKDSFVYKLINKALRTEDIELLYVFRFFVGDLSKNLENEHEKLLSSNEEMFTVYRGVHLDKEEFHRLKQNQGQLISTNGYLSTSRNRSKAQGFALKSTRRTDTIAVLFQIECYIKQIDKSIIFADISQFSEFNTEKEVLFDLNACFRLESIQEEEQQSLQIIRMKVSNEGEQITKHFIQLTQKETEKQSATIVFGKLMCDLGKYDQSQKYFEQLLQNPNGEDIAWIEHNLGRIFHLKGQWEEARYYYNCAYDLMMTEIPARIKDSACVFNNIGLLFNDQGIYDQAIEYHQRALKMKLKFCSSDEVSVASSLNNIGNSLYMQRKYEDALNYHQQALEIKKKIYQSAHPSIATSLNNIGNDLKCQGNYTVALDYYQQALEIRQKYYLHDHVDIAQSYNNLGVVHFDQEQHIQALDYYQKALDIQKKCHPSGHLEIGKTLNNIGLCYEKQNQISMARDYYQHAMNMYEKFVSNEHSYYKIIEENIRRLTEYS